MPPKTSSRFPSKAHSCLRKPLCKTSVYGNPLEKQIGMGQNRGTPKKDGFPFGLPEINPKTKPKKGTLKNTTPNCNTLGTSLGLNISGEFSCLPGVPLSQLPASEASTKNSSGARRLPAESPRAPPSKLNTPIQICKRNPASVGPLANSFPKPASSHRLKGPKERHEPQGLGGQVAHHPKCVAPK